MNPFVNGENSLSRNDLKGVRGESHFLSSSKWSNKRRVQTWRHKVVWSLCVCVCLMSLISFKLKKNIFRGYSTTRKEDAVFMDQIYGSNPKEIVITCITRRRSLVQSQAWGLDLQGLNGQTASERWQSSEDCPYLQFIVLSCLCGFCPIVLKYRVKAD